MRMLGWIAVGVLLVGCQERPANPSALAREQQAYSELPGLKRTPHQGLQAELIRLLDDRATPLQLAAAERGNPRPQMVAAHPDLPTNPQKALRESFPALSRGMLREQMERIDPQRQWRVGPVERELLRDFVQQTSETRIRFHAALERCSDGFQLDPTHGPLADLEFLDPLELGCRLEGLVAVDFLADELVAESLQSLATMLRAAELLAREPHVTTRLAAANLRVEALKLLQEIVRHRKANHAVLQEAHRLVHDPLRQWPSDAQAWIGDRASGLITYEIVRDGLYLSLLAREELERLEAQGIARTTARAVIRGVDEDQVFYLETMRQMIAACEQPYHARTAALEQFRGQLESQQQTQSYPIVAAQLLLTDFETAHRRQAEDAARCLAWSVALQAALSDSAPALPPTNPLTGEPFALVREAEQVTVGRILLGSDESITVPLRRTTAN